MLDGQRYAALVAVAPRPFPLSRGPRERPDPELGSWSRCPPLACDRRPTPGDGLPVDLRAWTPEKNRETRGGGARFECARLKAAPRADPSIFARAPFEKRKIGRAHV